MSYFRSWMDEEMYDPESSVLNDSYARGICEFMALVGNQPQVQKGGKIKCPCLNCCNSRNVKVEQVWHHLYTHGFMPGYKIWFFHGETNYDGGSSSSAPYVADSLDEHRTELDFGVGTAQMVHDAFRENLPSNVIDEDIVEEPNVEDRRFFDMLDAGKTPLYHGCRDGHSPLSTASRMMTIKTDFNLAEDCVDAIADMVKDLLPEDNVSPASYYEIQKLVGGLGLPYKVIDVCIDNCMLYWREDEYRRRCKFCRKPRYQDTSGRVPIPYKRMWYLPLTARLKRLYQSARTAEEMRWHAEHRQDGEITHPSDAKAWKHFQSLYPDFAFETRNVYLGLSTDGFNPFGKHGRQYSLWPVIVTPYNLPPGMCMQREFLFLSILVPGPEHPKRSLDVFLQPLIYELQMLWSHGVEVFDVSRQQNFCMRAVLMWTISDFPAYGMLSGWTTHGRLSCPYCQDNTDAFQLRNGRKSCWFDCHRRFLPDGHPYRRSKRLFKKNKQVFDPPLDEIDGSTILEHLRDFGAERTPECGGNGHEPVCGVGEAHNWHKKSIFWDLPYWKDHLLRHNLDVMHVEKNFFDNIINTVLNVPGKTKDNLKSWLDMTEICKRDYLELLPDGTYPFPPYRLQTEKIKEFLGWIKDEVKFTDGYASNLHNCVDSRYLKFMGMKSHDCHVVMQRLLPFAFTYLLPRNVHEAIAGVGAFFRDLCTRTLTVEGIRHLEVNIPVILCNLEKIFPPSFFDVMEHLPLHLPREAELGGPVQFRWMYPFERYMFHLKKKVKNLARVEGSIVAQSINEEASQFGEYYFPLEVRTKSRRPVRHDDRGEKVIYPVVVPELFSQVGRFSGKGKKRQLSEEEWTHLHYYILTNCEEMAEYERKYMDLIRGFYPEMTEEELQEHKENDYIRWLQYYVTEGIQLGQTFPTWLQEFVYGPSYMTTSYPRYCSRGFAFKIHDEERSRSTADYGISATSGDVVYYGILKQILQVRYPGMLDMRCIVFLCDWYDTYVGRGVEVSQFGVTSINSNRRLEKYDPFILASQADQVCYISYPRVTHRGDPWITVTPINPRGRIYGVSEHDAMQPTRSVPMEAMQPTGSASMEFVVEFTEVGDNIVHSESEEEIEEFDEDSIPSEGSESESD